MSLLSKICKKINESYLPQGDVVLKPVVENPRIFTMLRISGETNSNMGFYHVCNPRLLLTALSVSEFKERTSLNEMLNLYIGRVLDTDSLKGKQVTACGKCFLEAPPSVVSRLAIITGAAKLKLR